ncbi:hypothetical protein A7R79_37560 [Pseudomonas aeruginosa]|nr:hypothetical protein A7R79_37560 [Pseudomonas aeruginosa]
MIFILINKKCKEIFYQILVMFIRCVIIIICLLEKVMTQRINQHPLHCNAMVIFPSSDHFTKPLQVAIGRLVQLINFFNFSNWIAVLPAPPIICIRVCIASILILKRGQNLYDISTKVNRNYLLLRPNSFIRIQVGQFFPNLTKQRRLFVVSIIIKSMVNIPWQEKSHIQIAYTVNRSPSPIGSHLPTM